MLSGCGASRHPAVEDLTTHQELAAFQLGAVSGTRDGDHLDARALFTDSSSILTVEMRFLLGSPTRLESGRWRWTRNNQLLSGMVTARSVTFLGGQDGPPSIGGSFVLIGSDHIARYRVAIPLTQLKDGRSYGSPRLHRPAASDHAQDLAASGDPKFGVAGHPLAI